MRLAQRLLAALFVLASGSLAIAEPSPEVKARVALAMAEAEADTQPTPRPPAAPVACQAARCANGRCGVVGADGVRQDVAVPLPAGFAWVDTPAGYGLRAPDGSWYKEPDPENTRRVRRGEAYTPTPESSPWPHGYWHGVCVRDGACSGPVSARVVIAQDGKPVDLAAQAAVPPHDPNAFPGGASFSCRPCPASVTVTPIPFRPTPLR